MTTVPRDPERPPVTSAARAAAVPAAGDPEPTEPQLSSAADTFALLASPARLHLVWLMVRGRHDVGTLAERVGLSLPTTSQHLSRLRLAGIVSATREGRHSYYAVEDPHVVGLVEQIFEHIAPDGTLAPDPTPDSSRTPDGWPTPDDRATPDGRPGAPGSPAADAASRPFPSSHPEA